MIKKYLMVVLSLIFVLTVFLVVVLFSRQSAPTAISVPFLNQTSPTQVPAPTAIPDPKLVEIENDLKMIRNDLQKIKDDQRLSPPSFIFDLGEIK